MPTSSNHGPRRTMLLTGASRGIGHATVIRFSSAGWRVLTCSRHPFPEECPWGAGPEDHIQVDLADHADTTRAIAEIRQRLEGGELHALVNNAAISPKAEGGGRLGSIDTDVDTWSHVFRVNFFAPIMMARGLLEGIEGRQGLGGERHLDRRLPRPPFRGRGLRHLEGGAGLPDPRDGVRFRPLRRPRQFDRTGRNRHLDPVAGHREDRRSPDPAAPARHAG